MAEGEDGGEVKELTITSFGLIIAYLLPGLIGLYGMSFWFPRIGAAFQTFLTSESNVGLFLLIVLGALAVGLLIHGIRWIIVEVWCSGKDLRLDPELFARLSGERKMPAFRTAVDEIYRYHQWWGGMAIAGPVLFFGWLNSPDSVQDGLSRSWYLWLAFLALQALVMYAAWRVWGMYVTRLQLILKGEESMSGVGVPVPGRQRDPEPEKAPEKISQTQTHGR
jgi:hypothetical protein